MVPGDGMAGRPIARLVRDDGEWFSPGDRVRLDRTRSAPEELHAFRDPDGPYEVLTCRRVPIVTRPLLQLILHEVEPT